MGSCSVPQMVPENSKAWTKGVKTRKVAEANLITAASSEFVGEVLQEKSRLQGGLRSLDSAR